MIDVRVGQEHEIEPAEVAFVGLTVLARCLAPSLEHAVVDQEADVARLDHQARPGDLTGSTMESQTHLRILRAFSTRSSLVTAKAQRDRYARLRYAKHRARRH